MINLKVNDEIYNGLVSFICGYFKKISNLVHDYLSLGICYNGSCMVCCDCLATNLVRINRTLGKSVGFSEYRQTQAINYTHC